MKKIKKPEPGEYPAYASMYIDLFPDDGLLLQHLEDNFKAVKELILSLPEEKLLYRYAPGKWTIKEILVHIIDDERIYSYGRCVLQGMMSLRSRVLNRMILQSSQMLIKGTWEIYLKNMKQ
jgi:hypothetical protein